MFAPNVEKPKKRFLRRGMIFMDRTIGFGFALLVLSAPVVLVNCKYHLHSSYNVGQQTPMNEKVTKLHFFFHDTISGEKPSAVLIAHPAKYDGSKVTPFGTAFAIDDPLTEGLDPKSKIVGNCRGIYVSTSQDQSKLTLVSYYDFAFTEGEFNGSSISVFSRNPVMETRREMAVVGGTGKFRLARGWAELLTRDFNTTSGNAIVEFWVTVLHYG